jgi:hypothetical protein
VKKPDVEGMACHGYTWPAVVRPVGCTAKWSKTMLEAAYGREILRQQLWCTLYLQSSMPITHIRKSWDICDIVLWQMYILECPYIVPSTRCTCVVIMLFNTAYWYATSDGWIILANEKCSLTGM